MRARPTPNLLHQFQTTWRSKNVRPIGLALELEVELEFGFDVDVKLEIYVEIEVEPELALEPNVKNNAPTLVVAFFRGRRQWPQARKSADPGGQRGVRGCRRARYSNYTVLEGIGARGLRGGWC